MARIRSTVCLAILSVACMLAASGAFPLPSSAQESGAPTQNDLHHRECVYTGNSRRALEEYARLVQRRVACAVVFNDSASTWAEWEHPWFINQRDPDKQWASWHRMTGGQLILTQSLIPTKLLSTDWRDAGYKGKLDAHFRALARNLVAAHLGSTVIRLGAEANDPSNRYAVGTSERDESRWRQYWRRAVRAMRSVPKSSFIFDWTINAHYRPIPLRHYYPGNDVVDVIGIDLFDETAPGETPSARWKRLRIGASGLDDVVRFAQRRGKPISVPEWGLADPSHGGAGDDPTYMHNLLRFLATENVAYDGYFYSGSYASVLRKAPRSLGVLRTSR